MYVCYISTLNKQSFEIEIDPKEIGQVVLNKVLEIHDIVEVDFFGLKYLGPKKEELWLNLRNRVCDQIIGSTHFFRLKLRVKFFVDPDHIQQDATKELFYLQARDALCKRQIMLSEPHCEESKLVKIVAFIAQAEHHDQTRNSYQYKIYEQILKEVYPGYQPTEAIFERIHAEHGQLQGMPAASARFFFLQEVSTLQGYGMEHHRVHSDQGGELCFGVGPDGILLHWSKTGVEKAIPYSQIRLATHNDKSVNIQLNDDRGEQLSEELYKLSTRKAAIALYRCITEMHSFYRCDTVGPDVQSQYCRDLKGTFVSIFNENSDFGKHFVFDIQRTSKEAFEEVQKILTARSHSANSSPLHTATTTCQAQGSTDDEEEETEEEEGEEEESLKESLAGPALIKVNKNLLKENKRLKRRLETVEDSLLCCICMYEKVSIVLCPCGHMTCDTCSLRIDQCPQCRTDIERFQKVYQTFGGNSANKVCHTASTADSTTSLEVEPNLLSVGV